MLKKVINKLFSRQIMMYLILGVLTTAVNWVVTFVCQRVFGLNEAGIKTTIANGIAWFCAVLFAFITNRAFVFEKTNNGFWTELVKFYGARTFTGIFETFLPDGIVLASGLGSGKFKFLAADLFGITGGVAKAITAVIVIILNYILSKVFVFKRKNGDKTVDLPEAEHLE